MKKRDFLSTDDWSPEEIDELLALAERIKHGEVTGGLERKVLAMVFLNPSLRTRSSFEAAMFLHGGHALVLEPGLGSWAWETEMGAVMDGAGVEHLVDAARSLSRYGDAVGLRSFPKGADWAVERQDSVLRNFALHCEKPVINLESARRHPCQGLADALTLHQHLKETRGRRFVLAWAWHPKPLPTAVPASAALAAAQMGMEIVIARPEGYDLDPDDMAAIGTLAHERGSSVRTVDNIAEALEGADAVYAKSWGSLGLFGRPEEEKALRAPLRSWRLTVEALLRSRGGAAKVMHCLPVRRNVEIDDAVLDGPWSVVVDQAENRLHAQRALLLTMLDPRGTRSWTRAR